MIRRHTRTHTVYARNDNELGDENTLHVNERRILNMFWLVGTYSGEANTLTKQKGYQNWRT